MGAGRTELALSVFGNRPGYQIKSGELYLDGKRVHFNTPKDAIEAGVAYATEDRKRNGLILIQDIMFNVSLANLQRIESGRLINQNEEIIQVDQLKEAVSPVLPAAPADLEGDRAHQPRICRDAAVKLMIREMIVAFRLSAFDDLKHGAPPSLYGLDFIIHSGLPQLECAQKRARVFCNKIVDRRSELRIILTKTSLFRAR